MVDYINTIIIGGGQGGLAVSYILKQHGHPHIILDKADQIASSWRNRWDSFTLITPNWMVRLPGEPYTGDNPEGFMTRNEIVAFFETYVHRYNLPLELGVCVNEVKPCAEGYSIKTNRGELIAANVVIATGFYQRPKTPRFSEKLSPHFMQLHSSQYKNPQSLPDDPILVVGSAQSGAQIAEELYQEGRKVFLSVSDTGRLPRRYRGKDFTHWMEDMGDFARTVDQLSSPKDRYASSSHGTGKNGGHTINLHQFARDGVTLLGHILNAKDDRIMIAPDMKENLAKADQFEAKFTRTVDQFIEKNNISAPLETLPTLRDGFKLEEIHQLNLTSAGITSIIWATGYQHDYQMVKLPVCDADGYPIQHRGVAEYPGLYFIGMPFLYSGLSGVIAGVGQDAEYIASVVLSNQKSRSNHDCNDSHKMTKIQHLV